MINRMIGILVILGLGVLLSPFLLNPHDAFSSAQSEAMLAPPFPNPVAQNDTIKALKEHHTLKEYQKTANSNKLMPFKQKSHVVKIANYNTKTSKHGKIDFKNAAWVIQLGIFKDKTSALGLVNRLRAKGYNAFIQQKGAAFGEEMQVFIGPEIKRDSAVSIASKLEKETKLTGVIKSYKLLAA